MYIGSIKLDNSLVLAPMAGVTDLPFRNLCRSLGAGLAISEMVTSDVRLYGTRKSRRRLDHRDEKAPRAVQIAGSDPASMAEAARLNVDHGAQVIDINMGCPAKKVCNVAAGSALLRDEDLVGRILSAVVSAVDVPVTLKIRTGWDTENRNAVNIARLAEDCGVQMLSVHGRTRACRFGGEAEFDTVRRVKGAVSIPVLANGDIDSGEKVREVLSQTGVDGVMIGRAAQGRPWIFREIAHYLETGQSLAPPGVEETRIIMIHHIEGLHDFYGEYTGVRVARKHIGWYLKGRTDGETCRRAINQVEQADRQRMLVNEYFDRLGDAGVLAA